MSKITNEHNRVEKHLSVVVAIRNEEEHIQKCLDSLVQQNFPHDEYEIIVVDGMSDDKTRNILSEYKRRYPNLIKIFDNPKRIQAAGWNIGIRHAAGKIVQIFGGHAFAEHQYLSKLVKVLEAADDDVAGVGGVHVSPDDETLFGKIMADVQGSILGGFGTSYRQKDSSTYVDTVAFTAYKKNILETVGLYDENFVTGQDRELNLRITKAGFKLMICHDAIVFYYRRHGSFKLLSNRMFRYGIWRAFIQKKHRDSLNVLFFVPSAMVAYVALLPVLAFFYQPLATFIIIGFVAYLSAIIISSLHLSAKRKSAKSFVIAVLIYLTEHYVYGLGFLIGLLRKHPQDGTPR